MFLLFKRAKCFQKPKTQRITYSHLPDQYSKFFFCVLGSECIVLTDNLLKAEKENIFNHWGLDSINLLIWLCWCVLRKCTLELAFLCSKVCVQLSYTHLWKIYFQMGFSIKPAEQDSPVYLQKYSIYPKHIPWNSTIICIKSNKFDLWPT